MVVGVQPGVKRGALFAFGAAAPPSVVSQSPDFSGAAPGRVATPPEPMTRLLEPMTRGPRHLADHVSRLDAGPSGMRADRKAAPPFGADGRPCGAAVAARRGIDQEAGSAIRRTGGTAVRYGTAAGTDRSLRCPTRSRGDDGHGSRTELWRLHVEPMTRDRRHLPDNALAMGTASVGADRSPSQRRHPGRTRRSVPRSQPTAKGVSGTTDRRIERSTASRGSRVVAVPQPQS
jgi:hypothetical protein